ncbi:hypothetical protein [Luteimonas saliphila]|uniref:hypothetical protein n=1 Tax=Luteimonas saliphila TaxID=2804919 RepID=UPI00192D8B5F|nr:hypothetical protein [Luteimonas saliphila]
MAKKTKPVARKKAADPLAKLTARVAELERREADRRKLAAQVVRSMETAVNSRPNAPNAPSVSSDDDDMPRPATPEQSAKRAGRLAAELLQEDYMRLRGVRRETVRKSLGMSRRPWRDLLPRWVVRLLDRCGGL